MISLNTRMESSRLNLIVEMPQLLNGRNLGLRVKVSSGVNKILTWLSGILLAAE
jgi:hypothetical protein